MQIWIPIFTMLNMFSFGKSSSSHIAVQSTSSLCRMPIYFLRGLWVLGCKGHNNSIFLIKVYLISASTADVVLKGKDHSIKCSVCSISSKVDLGGLKNMKKVNKNYVNDYCILLQKFPRWTVYSDTQFKKKQFIRIETWDLNLLGKALKNLHIKNTNLFHFFPYKWHRI